MPLVYNKRNYVMAKTLTEHDQSSYSTISILERVYSFKTIMILYYIFEKNLNF